MPRRSVQGYEGGSGLADLLSGLVSGYQAGSALKSQRDADKLAKDREARYAAEEAAKQKQQELENNRQRLLDEAAGRYTSTDGLDMGATVTTRDNSDVRSSLGSASRALADLPGFEASSTMLGVQAPAIKDQTQARYQATGTGALDRTRTDPFLMQQVAADKKRVEEQQAARALDGIAPGAGALVRAGVNGDTAFTAIRRQQEAAAALARQQAEKAATQRQAATVAQQLYGISPDVAQAAASSGLLETVLKGINDQRSDDRDFNRSMAVVRETARLRPPAGGAAGGVGGAGGTAPVALLPTSEDERKSAFHYVLGSQAVDILRGQNGSWGGEMAAKVPLVGNVIQGTLAPKQQAMDQAAKQLAESYIFAITGAAAPESQMARLIETIKPIAGDDETTKAQKEQTRASYLQAIRARAGRAYQNMQAQGIIGQDGTIPKPQAVDPAVVKEQEEAKALYDKLIAGGTAKDEARRQVQTIYGSKP